MTNRCFTEILSYRYVRDVYLKAEILFHILACCKLLHFYFYFFG